MVPHCQAAILVCGDMTLARHEGSWVQDCSATTQNLLLAAHAKGLGAVWLGVYPYGERVEGIKDLVGLPDHVYPLALVPMGHPAEKIPQPDRFNKTRTHRDRW
jgi:nitroreductase